MKNRCNIFNQSECNTHEKRTFDSNTYESVVKAVKAVKAVNKNKNMCESTKELVRILEHDDKLPAIIFNMSRDMCVTLANSINNNLLMSPRPKQKLNPTVEEEYEFAWLLEQHSDAVKNIRNKQDALFDKHLQRYKVDLDLVPEFDHFMKMVDRGIAYHHAGMLPILREYIEILFDAKLIKVVFATETLGVGINMPARSTVFTQLDKPTSDGIRRVFHPNEFWQMAGRAGRRGMDDHGYVIYYPLKGSEKAFDVRDILTGRMASAKSQLKINPHVVLTQDTANLDKSMLVFQNAKHISSLSKQLALLPKMDDCIIQDTRQIEKLKQSLSGIGSGDFSGLAIKMSGKQKKAAMEKIKILETKLEKCDINMDSLKAREALEVSISNLNTDMELQIKECKDWLLNRGFVDDHHAKTVMGQVCATFADNGSPLVRASMLCSGMLDGLSRDDIIIWLAGFTENIACSYVSCGNIQLLEKTKELMVEDYMDNAAFVISEWLSNKDIRYIASILPIHQMGSFVRIVLRVLAMIDEMRPAIMGIGKYELYNKLDGCCNLLMGGIVTNISLYCT